MTNNPGIRECTQAHYVIRLFVTGNAPNSRLAKQNLKRLQEKLSKYRFEIDIIDINHDPQAALEEGVYVTPALQILKPDPGQLIFGNLNDHDILQQIFPEEI